MNERIEKERKKKEGRKEREKERKKERKKEGKKERKQQHDNDVYVYFRYQHRFFFSSLSVLLVSISKLLTNR